MSLHLQEGEEPSRERSPRGSLSAGSVETVMEHTELSDTWQVFLQLMLALPPLQPVIILATAHTDLLPADLLRYFGQHQASPALLRP